MTNLKIQNKIMFYLLHIILFGAVLGR